MIQHRICIVLAVVLLLGSMHAQTHIPLHSKWEFRRSGDSLWLPAEVPGCIHTDLMRQGKLKDPFYAMQEIEAQWVETANWEYRTKIHADKKLLKQDGIALWFEGLDTYADVFLNDSLILRADNMFRQWQVEIKNLLHVGENDLRILFRSAVLETNVLQEKYQMTLPPDARVFARKAQYQFGWDWGPRLVTTGIWQPVYLKTWNSLEVTKAAFQVREKDNDTASVHLDLQYQAGTRLRHKVLVRETSSGKIVYAKKYPHKLPTLDQIEFDFAIPARWEPHDLGDQPLYHFEVVVSRNRHIYFRKTFTTGFSNIRLHQEPDSSGKAFYFTVNGNPVFIKGANIIPLHSFPSEAGEQEYRQLLWEAKNMGINMLRVWGGGHYFPDIFYNLCDSMGIMVWQDFMFACGMYPYDPTVIYEIEQQGTRLKDHPCIALWCGNNEIDEGWNNWGWQKQFGYTEDDSAYLDGINNKIFRHIIPEALYTGASATQSYHASSPVHGWGRKESMLEGDAHYWGVWWGKMPFDIFNDKVPRFMSEYGFQAMPSMNTIKKMLPPEDRYLYSPALRAHQKHPTGFETINDYMQRDFPVPDALHEYAYVSQLLQAEGMRIAIEAHRRNMPYCMGTMFWQLNDCWPVVSWSVIDFNGDRKASTYAVKRSYQDAMVSVLQKNEHIETWLIQDTKNERPVTVKYALIEFNGHVIDSGSTKAILPANGSILFSELHVPYFLRGHDSAFTCLHIQVYDNDSLLAEKVHFFTKPKDLRTNRPEFSIQVDPVSQIITVTSNTLVYGAHLYSNDGELKLSDNFMHLLPNVPKQIYLQQIPSTGFPLLEDLRIECLNDLL